MNTNSALIIPAQSPAATNAAPAPFRDSLKPLIAIPNFWLWMICIAIVLVLAVAAWFLWRYWRKKAAMIRLAPPVPPHVHARRMLEHALSLISKPKPFSTAVFRGLPSASILSNAFSSTPRTGQPRSSLYELQESRLLTPEQKAKSGRISGRSWRPDQVRQKCEPMEVELRALHAVVGSAAGQRNRTARGAGEHPVVRGPAGSRSRDKMIFAHPYVAYCCCCSCPCWRG